MLLFALMTATIAGAADSTPRQVVGPRATPAGVTAARADTAPQGRRPRPRSIDISDAYATRLRIHRIASYATIPLFAAQFAAGQTLFNADANGTPRPAWAKSVHRPIAYTLGGLFLVNTVTGTMNWWETHDDGSPGLAWRTVHAALMLAADAGFAYAGSMGTAAKSSFRTRETHRQWAIASMAVALTGYAMMLPAIRDGR